MAVQFLSLCYRIKPEDQQSSFIPTRIKVWYRKVSTNTHYNPSLKQIPPTDNSFRANGRRAHYQAAIWRSCEAQDPPQESPEDFGWYKDDINGIMLPKFHDTSPVLAPVDKVPVQTYGRPVHAQEMFLQRGQCALYQVLRMFI